MQDNSLTKKSVKTSSFTDNETQSINGSMPGRKLQVAEIMEKIGEFGRLHYRILILCILMSIATSANTFSIAFVMKDPHFMCKNEFGDYYDCNQEHACKNAYGYRLDYEMDTMVTEFKLYCDRRWMKIYGQSILFIVSSFLSTVIMFVLERFGRRLIFFVVAFMTFGLNVALLFSTNYWVLIVLFTFLWGFSYLFNTNFYVYSTEIFNGKWRSVANSTFFFFHNASKIIYILFNLAFTSYKDNYWLIFGLGCAFLPLVFFLVETPYHYHRVGNIKALKENLEYINRVNNFNKPAIVDDNIKIIAHSLKVETLTQKELVDVSAQEIDRKAKKPIFTDKLTLKSYLIHLLLIIITVIPNYVEAALIDTVPAKLGIDNIYISSISFTSVYIIVNFILMFYLHKIQRKKGNIIIVLITVIISIILLLFSILGIYHDKPAKWAELALTLIASGIRMAQFLLISRYVNEVFPTKLRAVSIATVLEIGRSSMFLGNLLDLLAEKADVHPFVFLGAIFLITLPCYWRYEETLSKPTKN